MIILLTGHWDHGGNLVVKTSDVIDPNSDDEEWEDDLGTMGWSASFDVSTHKEAVRLAYEDYVRHEETDLIDEVKGFSIRTEVSA